MRVKKARVQLSGQRCLCVSLERKSRCVKWLRTPVLALTSTSAAEGMGYLMARGRRHEFCRQIYAHVLVHTVRPLA